MFYPPYISVSSYSYNFVSSPMVVILFRFKGSGFWVLGSKVEETAVQYFCYPDLQFNPEP